MPRLQELYAHCDLFVAPSIYESFGLRSHPGDAARQARDRSKAGGIPRWWPMARRAFWFRRATRVR